MYEGRINKIFYSKNDFYIFSIILENHKQLTLKGNLTGELADLVQEGNIAKTDGQITWNEKYKKEEINVNQNNLEIIAKKKKEEELKTITGEVVDIIYKGDSFNVFELSSAKGEKNYNCVANAPAFIGTELELKGYFEKNQYGLNFQVVESQELPFSSQKTLINFLSSKFFKGIGKHFATKIVDEFGLDTLEVLKENPARLKEIAGIGEKRANTIMTSFNEKMKIKRIIKFAVKYNITERMIFKLYEKYGEELINLLHKNPYLITELRGIAFKKADKIAREIGLEKDSNYRINSFLSYYLSAKSDGHTYFKLEELLEVISKKLELENPFNQVLKAYYEFEAITYNVIEEGEMKTERFTKDFILFNQLNLKPLDETAKQDFSLLAKREKLCIATEKSYQQEIKIYKKLRAINDQAAQVNLNSTEIEKVISQQEKEQGFNYAKQQQKILKECLKEKLVVLTGKAGTGKSTVAKGIIMMYQKNGAKVLNLAPTGKAAKRVIEVTGKKAHTIHSACYNLDLAEYDVIMVDEAGMLSTSVAHMLIKRLKDEQQLVLIGDIAQIPPVQPGNIFRDIINMIQDEFIAGLFVELDEIKRQDSDSNIATVCNKIAEGKRPAKIAHDDIRSYKKSNEQILDFVKELVRREIEENNLDFNQLQIISPQYNGIVGINAINELIQQEFNPHDYLIETQYKKIKQHDKVMQTVNMKEFDLANGDTLEVLDSKKKTKAKKDIKLTGESKKEEVLICKLDNGLESRKIEYPKKDFIKYTNLAYCCSAHKMQGSEYPVVIYILSTSHYIMLNRNLLYTGLTRGKDRVHLVGQPKAFQIALNNEVNQSRNTVLDIINSQEIKL